MRNAQDTRTRHMVVLAMLAALAYVVMAVGRIPISFLTYEPKDVIVAFAGLLYGPLGVLAVCVPVSLLEMVTVSSTGIIGCVMSILASCLFALPAAFLYRRRRTLGSAVAGLAAGVLLLTAGMLAWNWLLTPLYLHTARAEVVKLLVPLILPFNLFKGGLNAALTLLLYKPAMQGLRRARLVESPAVPENPRTHLGGMLTAAGVLLAAAAALFLFLKGVL